MDGSLWPGRFVRIGLNETYDDVFGIFGGVKFTNSGIDVQLVLDDTKLTVGFGVMCIVGDGLSVEPGNTKKEKKKKKTKRHKNINIVFCSTSNANAFKTNLFE